MHARSLEGIVAIHLNFELLYYQIIAIESRRREVFLLQFYEILFSHVFFSCEKVVIIYDSRAHPQNLFKWKEFFFAKFISNGKWAAIQMSQLLEAISGSLFAFQMKNMFPHISFIIPCDSLLCCCTSYTCSIILRCFSKKEAICEDFQLISLVNW